MPSKIDLTPSEIVAELDKYIIGQADAKRAVAIAMRNRYRRQQLADDIREEVAPKNIIMSGPTGVGKTEIARRLAGLVGAPFVKVEATKFTEVGYVGRDVESMVRDLVERAIQMEREEQSVLWSAQAAGHAEERLLDCLLPVPVAQDPVTQDRHKRTREKLREQLLAGNLEDREVEVSVQEKSMPVGILSNVGLDQMGPEMENMFEKLMPSRSAARRVNVTQARQILHEQELDKLIDQQKMIDAALKRTEQSGMVFIDEIDKVCGAAAAMGAEVSREGVQRDLLPLVEGTTVNTRHGQVKTDHILFVAAGAFSRNKPADLMPELQGRFPIRVKLKDLTEDDFRRILTEPNNALTVQQVALLKTEGVEIEFADDAVAEMAAKAFELNRSLQNIGARRLYAVMEKVFEQISFDAPDKSQAKYIIDAAYVREHLRKVTQDEDLNIFGFAAGTSQKKN